MELSNPIEVQNTREKLLWREQFHDQQSLAPAENAYARELTLKSIRKMVDQLKGEIAWFEARTSSAVTEVDGPEPVSAIRPGKAG
jgi:hypothetical protein